MIRDGSFPGRRNPVIRTRSSPEFSTEKVTMVVSPARAGVAATSLTATSPKTPPSSSALAEQGCRTE
jgi:hypothetical protein